MSEPPKLQYGTALTVGELRKMLDGIADDVVVQVWLAAGQDEPDGTDKRVATIEPTKSILDLSNNEQFVVYGYKDGYPDWDSIFGSRQ